MRKVVGTRRLVFLAILSRILAQSCTTLSQYVGLRDCASILGSVAKDFLFLLLFAPIPQLNDFCTCFTIFFNYSAGVYMRKCTHCVLKSRDHMLSLVQVKMVLLLSG